MNRIEPFLEAVVRQRMPLPPGMDYRENFVMAASEIQVGTRGLRAVIISEKLPNAPSSLNGISLQASVMEAAWSDQGEGSAYPRFHTDVVVDDAVGTPGAVRRAGQGFSVTLPKRQGEHRGGLLAVPNTRECILDALQAKVLQQTTIQEAN